MKRLSAFLLVLAWCAVFADARAQGTGALDFEQTIDLIHAYNGTGDELQRAREIARGFARSHPGSGYAQTLAAELLSTWELDQEGDPPELRAQILRLCDEALRLNPRLAQAHVAKGRTLVRSSRYREAVAAIDAALRLDPNLSGAIFLRAEVARRTGNLSEGNAWYLRFIESTPSQGRKANGYFWLGKMYDDAAWDDERARPALLLKARDAYERMLQLDPDGPFRNIDFATFLNEYPADFAGAERHALKALSIRNIPTARYQLAAARYQQLWAQGAAVKGADLEQAVKSVAASTGIALRDASLSAVYSSVVKERLIALQARAQGFPK